MLRKDPELVLAIPWKSRIWFFRFVGRVFCCWFYCFLFICLFFARLISSENRDYAVVLSCLRVPSLPPSLTK